MVTDVVHPEAGPLAMVGNPVKLSAAPEGPVDFNQDVQPVLSEHCFACHVPDAEQRKVGLRLDTEGGLFEERNGRAMVVAGGPARDSPAAHLPEPVNAGEAPVPR